MSTRYTHADRTQAAIHLAAWRATGAPALVTGHEAWRLSDGLAGIEGDHGTRGAVTLAALALATARAERMARRR